MKAITWAVRALAVAAWLGVCVLMVAAGMEPDTGRAIALSWFVAFPLALIAIVLSMATVS